MSGYRVENTTIHVTVLLQISLHYVRFHTRFALPMSMAAPLWRLVCQTKSNRIQAVAQELVKISLFYIYMNRYLHIKVFSFVPKVDLTFRIGHMSENISYYGLLQLIRYKHKYNANIRIRIGFWVANIRIQFFVFVSALSFEKINILTNSCATAWMQSDFVWHISLHKGAAIVAMQISHEISYCARFGVEHSCRWQQTFV